MPRRFASRCCANAPALHRKRMREKHETLRGSEVRMLVPPLETERLLIRAFRLEDLNVIHHILDIELRTADFGSEQARTREERERWLQWTVLSYDELARLYQPPYGDRAMLLKSTQQVIGAAQVVPSFGPFSHLPSLRAPSPYA